MSNLSSSPSMKETVFTCIILCVIFLSIFSFYTFVNPIIPYDGDDWKYLGSYREPFPKWGGWNPTRILPEVLMPLTGNISAFLVYPIVRDYIFSFTLTTSFIISGTIVIFMYVIKRSLEKILRLNSFMAIFLCILFLVLHFLFFISKPKDNMYMLYTFNLTTVFYYLIPDMLNCSLVLLMLKSSDFTIRFISYSRAKQSIFIIAVYFAIFSNLFCSEILGVFCFCVFVVPAYEVLNRKLSLKVFFRKYSIYLAIETLWLLSIFMEQSGGRANMIGGNKIFDFIGATKNFFRLLSSINHGIILGIIIIGISFLCLLLKKDKVILENKLLWKSIKFLSFYFFPMTLVSLLLAAKSVPGYAGIPNSMYGIFFIILLFILLALGCLIEKIYCFGIIMPLLILFSLISLMNIKPIIYSNTSNFMPQICVEVDRALINQFIDADKNGENQVNIYVPKWKGTNWPHSNDTIHSLSKILYQHGILTHSIQATIIPDDDFFKTYNIRTER